MSDQSEFHALEVIIKYQKKQLADSEKQLAILDRKIRPPRNHGHNGGVQCSTNIGPCDCGAWH